MHADSALRAEVIEKIRHACEKWGFFQVVNHGIPVNVLDGVIRGMREFNEQDGELKKELYTRTPGKKVYYLSNHDCTRLHQLTGETHLPVLWFLIHPNRPEELQSVCR
ncbi:putative non-heme dioxygenase domain, isopenicillin N synthase [Rosa chinensis]|uniref:Putative non-heme dioxygenase domain, isopenicillin N synthase n=1 Tax=Rosa chinensis TaxID=74649 RepID=A0A2P6R270_ROSCH|nr:1-aminocyclopropane-1-carboxylate oxidase homolog 1 [Rosa chinensis]PRQ40532.1 putative non-heme dioxygenase domain, isopenicillin N synthase [Rosa chinensis]